MLYGLCCGLLGSALMFLYFPLGLLPRRFSVFVAYFAVGLTLKNGKVVNVLNGHLPDTADATRIARHCLGWGSHNLVNGVQRRALARRDEPYSRLRASVREDWATLAYFRGGHRRGDAIRRVGEVAYGGAYKDGSLRPPNSGRTTRAATPNT